MIRSWLPCAFALSLVGCGNDLGYDPEIDIDGGVGDLPAAAGGLPCEVQTLLQDRCQTCHASTPMNGAPMSLITYRDLVSKNDNGIVIAKRALSRITSPAAQMPPLPATPVTAAEISAFESWVTAGTPPGECVAKPGPFDGPVVCTSGTMWTGGNNGSQRMHPGRACISCHVNESDAPRFRIAGTVYPTGHEPNECNGVTSATVQITDANGIVTNLMVNSAGNFFTTSSIPFPIRVAVLANGKRREMGPSPPNGNCNNCHTQDGANGAPGRITIPW